MFSILRGLGGGFYFQEKPDKFLYNREKKEWYEKGL